jgi:hypothetical protein
MVAALKQRVTIQPGGLIEVRSSELTPGAQAEVIVLVDSSSGELQPLASFIGSGKGCYSSIEDADAFIRSERDAWDR